MRFRISCMAISLIITSSAFSNTYIGCLKKKVPDGFSYGFVLNDTGDSMSFKIYASFDNRCFYSTVAVQSSKIRRAFVTSSAYLEESRSFQSIHPEFTKILNNDRHCDYQDWKTFEKLDQFGMACNGDPIFIQNGDWDFKWENYGLTGVLENKLGDSIIMNLKYRRRGRTE